MVVMVVVAAQETIGRERYDNAACGWMNGLKPNKATLYVYIGEGAERERLGESWSNGERRMAHLRDDGDDESNKMVGKEKQC